MHEHPPALFWLLSMTGAAGAITFRFVGGSDEYRAFSSDRDGLRLRWMAFDEAMWCVGQCLLGGDHAGR